MGWFGGIHPARERRAALHLLTQITGIDRSGRLSAIREVVRVEQHVDSLQEFAATQFGLR